MVLPAQKEWGMSLLDARAWIEFELLSKMNACTRLFSSCAPWAHSTTAIVFTVVARAACVRFPRGNRGVLADGKERGSDLFPAAGIRITTLCAWRCTPLAMASRRLALPFFPSFFFSWPNLGSIGCRIPQVDTDDARFYRSRSRLFGNFYKLYVGNDRRL